MTYVKVNQVHLNLPVYGFNAISFKKTLAASVTGGRLVKETGAQVVRALSNISLDLKPGDRLGVSGHNGAGKSTLLRLLAGVYAPTCGSYEKSGKLASLIDPTMGIEMEATGIENITSRGLMLGLGRREIEKLVEEVSEFTQLGEYISMPVRTYSTGMLMRLSFAISTSMKADILLMDEWLAVGDKDFQERAESRMRDLLSNAGILILASHSSELLMKECNKQIVMQHGSIIEYIN